MAAFCARHHVSTATICAWKRGLRSQGEAGLVPREPRRNPSGKHGRTRSPEERRQAIEAFDRSKMTIDAFARTYGVSPWTMRTWVTRYRADPTPAPLACSATPQDRAKATRSVTSRAA
jgi:transposase-like protein